MPRRRPLRSLALLVGVVDLILYHVKDCLIDVVGAEVMEHDEIEEALHFVSGEGGQHVVSVVHGLSIAWIGGRVNPSGTVRELSHPVEHVVDRIDVVCLSGKGATVNRARVVCLRGRGRGDVATLVEVLLSVGVVGFVHADIIDTGRGGLGSLVDSLPAGTAAAAAKC